MQFSRCYEQAIKNLYKWLDYTKIYNIKKLLTPFRANNFYWHIQLVTVY